MSYLSAYHGLDTSVMFFVLFDAHRMLVAESPLVGWLMQAPVPMDTAKWRT